AVTASRPATATTIVAHNPGALRESGKSRDRGADSRCARRSQFLDIAAVLRASQPVALAARQHVGSWPSPHARFLADGDRAQFRLVAALPAWKIIASPAIPAPGRQNPPASTTSGGCCSPSLLALCQSKSRRAGD